MEALLAARPGLSNSILQALESVLNQGGGREHMQHHPDAGLYPRDGAGYLQWPFASEHRPNSLGDDVLRVMAASNRATVLIW